MINDLPEVPETLPAIGQTPRETFNANVAAFFVWLAEWAPELAPWAESIVTSAADTFPGGPASDTATIGMGDKTFTLPGKAIYPGMTFVMADAADPDVNRMIGTVTSYDISTGELVINVPETGYFGSGTKSAWFLSVTGKPGEAAPVGPWETFRISGRWYPTHFGEVTEISGATSQNVLSNTIYLIPFVLPHTIEIDALGCGVGGTSTATVDIAIYANLDGKPNGSPLVSVSGLGSGLPSTASTASTEVLERGLLWMAVLISGSNRALHYYGDSGSELRWINGASSSALTYDLASYTYSHTYGTWPDFDNPTLTENDSGIIPACIYKVA